MIIEVKVSVFREVMTRTSKLRKRELKLGRKPTTWIHQVKTEYDGKWKYVEVWDRGNISENGLGPTRNQTDSHPICSGNKGILGMVLAVQ